MQGILFAHPVSPHSSIKYSPFMLMCKRESVLLIDVNLNLGKDERKGRKNREGDGDEGQSFDLDFFDGIFSSVTKVRTTIANDLANNIKDAQKKTKTIF